MSRGKTLTIFLALVALTAILTGTVVNAAGLQLCRNSSSGDIPMACDSSGNITVVASGGDTVQSTFPATIATTQDNSAVSSGLYAYDSVATALVRLLVDANDYLYVNDATVRAWQDVSNGWLDVNRKAVESTLVSKSATSVTTSLTTVVDSIDISAYPNFSIICKNSGGQNFNAFEVRASPNETDWVDLTSTACDSLAASGGVGLCFEKSGHAYKYVRAQASVAASTSTADCHLQYNAGG